MPDPHAPGSPLPASSYLADTGYFADGTALTTAGNNSVTQAVPAPASNTTPAPTSAPAPAASPVGQNTVTHGRGFEYSVQRDAHADQEFTNDVGYLPDGTPMNRAGNAINHPDRILAAVCWGTRLRSLKPRRFRSTEQTLLFQQTRSRSQTRPSQQLFYSICFTCFTLNPLNPN